MEFYRANPLPFYSVTFELDATNVRSRARSLDRSTYAALCWAFHRALLNVEAFRVRRHGDDIVLYDTLHVGMTVPAPQGMFTFATPEWHEDADRFLRGAAETIEQASHGVDLSGGSTPDFAYYTAIPGVPFTSFTHVMHRDPDAGQLHTAFGRYTEKNGRVIVPVGLTVNHRYVDGGDLGALYEAAQASFTAAF
jgi:chloramphenicol O-acetyltransferase type A